MVAHQLNDPVGTQALEDLITNLCVNRDWVVGEPGWQFNRFGRLFSPLFRPLFALTTALGTEHG